MFARNWVEFSRENFDNFIGNFASSEFPETSFAALMLLMLLAMVHVMA
jgi:hypothetical protein